MRQQSKENALWVEIQLANGEGRLMPLNWTNQAPPMATLPEARFPLANLLALRQRLDGLLHIVRESTTLPLNHTQVDALHPFKEGGSDEIRTSAPLVEADRRSTCSSDSHSAPDSAAIIGMDRKSKHLSTLEKSA